MGKPAAVIGSMHVCPKVTSKVPHIGGPVAEGSPNVKIGGLPAARKGDRLVCVGPPDTISEGSSSVFINGEPAARVGDGTAHGGKIVIGSSNVFIGDEGGAAEKSKAAKVEVPGFELDEVLANPELDAVKAVKLDPASMLADDIESLTKEGKEFIDNPTLAGAASMTVVAIPGKLSEGIVDTIAHVRKYKGVYGELPDSAADNSNYPHTEVRFGPDGQVYGKLPAPSNPEVNRWQRMNPDGTSNRSMYMGSTPGKESRVGLQVQDRMRKDGTLVGSGDDRKVLGEDGNWYPINQTDMGHIESSVDYWNRLGRFQGARSPEVRSFMNDPDNYVLEPFSINRSKGAASGSKYLPVATEVEKKEFYGIDELE